MVQENFPIPHEAIVAYCQLRKITEFALFGSVLHENFNPNSDVDVLVTFDPTVNYSVFDLAKMRQELSNLFGRNVDLIEKAALRNPFRRQRILQDAEVIYAS